MEQAQFALKVSSGQPTQDLLSAIGEGIGNDAAHELAHHLVNNFMASGKVVGGMGLDDGSVDTYNGGSSAGYKAAWVFTSFGTDGKTPISWENSNTVPSLNER